MDSILDKISDTGMDSLTDTEKAFLKYSSETEMTEDEISRQIKLDNKNKPTEYTEPVLATPPTNSNWVDVTVSNLEDWEEENEEDVIVDGPYNILTDQWVELGKVIITRMENELNAVITEDPSNMDWYQDVYDAANTGNLDFDKVRNIALESMVSIINKYKIEKF